MYNEEENHIDELFQSALKGYEETPPGDSWDNIMQERSFAHVLLNQISLNWRSFSFVTILFSIISLSVIFGGNAQIGNEQNIAQRKQKINSPINQKYYTDSDYDGMLLAYSESSHVTDNEINKLEKSAYQQRNKNKRGVMLSKSISAFDGAQLYDEKDEVINALKSQQNIADNYKSKKQLTKSSQTFNTIVEPNNESPHHKLSLKSNLNLLQPNYGISFQANRNDLPLWLLDSSYYKNDNKKTINFKNQLFLNIRTGVDFSSKELSAKFPEYNSYSKQRNENEALKMGQNFQLTLSYYFINNLFIESGFKYSIINEQANYTFDKIISEKTIYDSTVIGYQVGPTGDPKPIYNITERTEREIQSTAQQSKNQYHFISVPLFIGYQIDLNRWSYYVKGGASAEILTKSSGYIKAFSTNNELDLSSPENPINTSVHLNFEIATGVGYQLSEKYIITIEPSYKTNISSLTKSEYPLNQKFETIGINAGIRIKL